MVTDPIRARLDDPDVYLDTRAALRAVLDLAECDPEVEAIGFDGERFIPSAAIRRVIAEHLGVSDARCVRCGGEGPFNSHGWCQDCASPVYT